MARYFSKIVDRYFMRWIRALTWDTPHPLDMERFYQFVKAVKRYSRKRAGSRLHENIIMAAKARHPELDQDYIDERADYFSCLAEKILNYESTPFPDPLVEMTNPYAVWNCLRMLEKVDAVGRSHPRYTEEQIEKKLADNFGHDWKEGYTK